MVSGSGDVFLWPEADVAPAFRNARLGQEKTRNRVQWTKGTNSHFKRCQLRPQMECHVMRKLSAIAFIVMLAAPLPAIAYTQADADACTPDAMRLCMHAVPDEGRVALCLVQNKQHLSPACTMVFNRPRAASTARQRSPRVQPTKF